MLNTFTRSSQPVLGPNITQTQTCKSTYKEYRIIVSSATNWWFSQLEDGQAVGTVPDSRKSESMIDQVMEEHDLLVYDLRLTQR
jgi:hypothetical protein